MRCRVYMNITPTTDKWSSKYAEGCEWCGTRIPAIKAKGKNGWHTLGLESAHIIAREYAPEHEWNVFLLCPTCHKIFDEVIKPRVQAALQISVTGYPNPPSSKARDFVSARDYKEAVERLSRPMNAGPICLAAPSPKKTLWTERDVQKNKSTKPPGSAANGTTSAAGLPFTAPGVSKPQVIDRTNVPAGPRC